MEINSRKRIRVELDSESNPPDSKRVASATESDPTQHESNKRYDSVESDQLDSDSELVDPFEVDGIPDDILDILENSETVNEHDPATQDLDSVIKSFEEEILHPSSEVPDLTSNSGESQPQLGYLLEASDDELGIPPTEDKTATNEPLIDSTVDNSSDSFEMVSMIEFENEFPSYDAFEFGLSESTMTVDDNSNNISSNDEFVNVDGLFDYSELSDFSGESWRAKSLPAL